MSLPAGGDPTVVTGLGDDGTAHLARILREAVALQPAAVEVIDECVANGEKTSDLAREGGHVASAYFRLREEIRLLPQRPELERASQLLNHHQQMVEQALGLAYRPHGPHRDAIAAHMSDRLGQPAFDMRAMLDRLSG
jgi:hypothetical protein